MSDRGYAIFVSVAKYVFINLFASVFMVILMKCTGFYSIDATILYYLIINCTALLMGKMQKILDKLNELDQGGGKA